METVNQEHYFNESFAWQQKYVLENQHKVANPALASVECNNNCIIYLDEHFSLGTFKLSDLPVKTYSENVSAKKYFDLVKFISYVENLINDYPNYIVNLKELLEKIVLSDQERLVVDDFINNYNFMKEHNEYFYGNSEKLWLEYKNIVNNIANYAKQNYFLTEGQLIINERINKKDINLNEEANGRGNSYTRVLKNPNFPNMAPDTESFEDQGYSKAGFASIILILYSLINAAIILAILMVK